MADRIRALHNNKVALYRPEAVRALDDEVIELVKRVSVHVPVKLRKPGEKGLPGPDCRIRRTCPRILRFASHASIAVSHNNNMHLRL